MSGDIAIINSVKKKADYFMIFNSKKGADNSNVLEYTYAFSDTLDLNSHYDFPALPDGNKVRAIDLLMQGAGGGGGGGKLTGVGGGKGGGGGASGVTLFVNRLYTGHLDYINITIGTGGTGGTGGDIGVTGGSTIVELPSLLTVTANGGGGGGGGTLPLGYSHTYGGYTPINSVDYLFDDVRGMGYDLKFMIYARSGYGGSESDTSPSKNFDGGTGPSYGSYSGGAGGTGTFISASSGSGGGGGSAANIFGNGAAGGNGGNPGTNGSNGGTYGIGGGGGGGSQTLSGNGGDGYDGYLRIVYYWN